MRFRFCLATGLSVSRSLVGIDAGIEGVSAVDASFMVSFPSLFGVGGGSETISAAETSRSSGLNDFVFDSGHRRLQSRGSR
jgi:hypothetical protein